MTIYTKKAGQYVALTRDQVRRLRRTNEVNELLASADRAKVTLRTMAAWLALVAERGNKIDKADLTMAAIPNRDKLVTLSDKLAESTIKIRGM